MELATYHGYHWRPSDPTEACVKWIGPEGGDLMEGKPFEEFTCLYPWLKNTYTEWELGWTPYWLGYFLMNNHWIPILSISVYAMMIIGGTAYFKDRKPWNLRYALMAWNLALSLFSIVGFFRVLPTVVHVVMNYTWQENLCFDPHIHTGHNEGGIWIMFFSLSKIAELLDTFFIVVHKKPLILLHWYHHVSVLLYCWFFLIYTAPAGIYFCLINYGVHAIMYMYYFLMAAKIKPSWMNPKVITIIQIVQMVGGLVITLAGVYLNIIGVPNCYTKPVNAAPTFVMYFSYFLLFGKFFYDRYVLGKGKKKAKSV